VNEEPNAEEMKGRVKEYEEANKAEIVVRQSQRAEEERNVADQIMAEKREVERKKRECWRYGQLKYRDIGMNYYVPDEEHNLPPHMVVVVVVVLPPSQRVCYKIEDLWSVNQKVVYYIIMRRN
jgi:hypothetical protein